ncbi:hypothetical protein DFH06DRAFT_1213743, partial [Mycena polygramma]
MYVNSPLDVYVNGQQCFLVEARRKLTGILSRPAGYPLHGIAGHPVPVCSSSRPQEVPNTGLHGRRHHPPRDSPQRPFSAIPFSRSSAMTLHSLSITTHRGLVECLPSMRVISPRGRLTADARQYRYPQETAVAALPTRTVPCRPSTCSSGGNCSITAVALSRPHSRAAPARRMLTLRRSRDALWRPRAAPPRDGTSLQSPATAPVGVPRPHRGWQPCAAVVMRCGDLGHRRFAAAGRRSAVIAYSRVRSGIYRL